MQTENGGGDARQPLLFNRNFYLTTQMPCRIRGCLPSRLSGRVSLCSDYAVEMGRLT